MRDWLASCIFQFQFYQIKLNKNKKTGYRFSFPHQSVAMFGKIELFLTNHVLPWLFLTDPIFNIQINLIFFNVFRITSQIYFFHSLICRCFLICFLGFFPWCLWFLRWTVFICSLVFTWVSLLEIFHVLDCLRFTH